MVRRRERSIGGPTQRGDVGKPGYATPGNYAQAPKLDRRTLAGGQGRQGETTCPVCEAQVTTKIADFTDRDAGIVAAKTRLLSPHRPGGGRVRVMRGDPACSGSLSPVADQ